MPESTPSVNVVAVVLAAGKSTRMKSRIPKGLHPLLGKPLLRFAIEAVEAAGVLRTVVVVGHQADLIRNALGEDYEYVLQAEQRGTGHALQMAAPLLGDWDGPILVLPGDAPLISPQLLSALLARHQESRAAATLLTAVLADAGSYGRIVRDPLSGRVKEIVEARDATAEQLQVGEINTSIYVFDPALLFAALNEVTPQNAQGEYYLTDVVAYLSHAGHHVEALISDDADIVRGVNTRVELAEIAPIVRQRILRQHMLDGVSILDPATTYIEATVKIGSDTTVHPFTTLTGVTDIGEECQIGPGARVSDSRLGNRVTVRDSWITASEVGDGTTVGPFANLRPGNIVGKDVKIGDFVELKQATLEDGVSAGHFAYLGNAIVGARTNIGAGAITCNYDGVNKNITRIGKDCFISTHSTLVAPVTIGDGAWTAAGSTITEDVPPGALGIGRARQVNKEGWVAHRPKKKSD